MRRLRTFVIGAAVLLVASMLLAKTHPFGDAGLYSAPADQRSIMAHSSVPPEVRATLETKCADCHSMQSRPPLYGRLAPISWLVERDIVEGRKRMNLSLWDAYTPEQQQVLMAKIAQQTREHKMPLLQYRMIHRNSRITDADVRIFTQWTRWTPGAFDEASTAKQAGEGDFFRGKEVFEKRCTGCHSLQQNREGPKLGGVYGRASASVAAFPYSTALVKARIVWNDSSLEQWLADPDAFVPGNNMDFHVAKAQERRDLISFLKKSSGQ